MRVRPTLAPLLGIPSEEMACEIGGLEALLDDNGDCVSESATSLVGLDVLNNGLQGLGLLLTVGTLANPHEHLHPPRTQAWL